MNIAVRCAGHPDRVAREVLGHELIQARLACPGEGPVRRRVETVDVAMRRSSGRHGEYQRVTFAVRIRDRGEAADSSRGIPGDGGEKIAHVLDDLIGRLRSVISAVDFAAGREEEVAVCLNDGERTGFNRPGFGLQGPNDFARGGIVVIPGKDAETANREEEAIHAGHLVAMEAHGPDGGIVIRALLPRTRVDRASRPFACDIVASKQGDIDAARRWREGAREEEVNRVWQGFAGAVGPEGDRLEDLGPEMLRPQF